ncbi:hypothetical protein [Methylobacterium gnaphalii]|uniref:Uncharacterized protein n=1 Tax=Methylobacterium gnaphalii TaxID=1010610 RepID=A0A512JF53_9HYPH|nr:hypothetical protein [Methylobacterium gnaphalii]GEP08577.1 hypothetical protein MGN01_04220 [Methylobacterium gnaphalii]GLS50794.1 hypothetical protein GCM10007885_36480 [Methylobacterium gnaphalii]
MSPAGGVFAGYGPCRVETSISQARLQQLARTGAPHLRPIYGAMANGLVGFLLVAQNAGRFDAIKGRPFVALLADDTDRALGPAGFHRKSVRRMAAQVSSIAIIASDIVHEAYVTAAAGAALGFNMLIVETRPEHEGAWMELLREAAPQASTLLCTPIEGTA